MIMGMLKKIIARPIQRMAQFLIDQACEGQCSAPYLKLVASKMSFDLWDRRKCRGEEAPAYCSLDSTS
jgi:hypothetical protein